MATQELAYAEVERLVKGFENLPGPQPFKGGASNVCFILLERKGYNMDYQL
jgi:hypothetical protein